MHPKGIDMHPKVAIGLHPDFSYKHNIHRYAYKNMNIALKPFFPESSDFLVHLHLHNRLSQIQWAIVKFSRKNASNLDFVSFMYENA